MNSYNLNIPNINKIRHGMFADTACIILKCTGARAKCSLYHTLGENQSDTLAPRLAYKVFLLLYNLFILLIATIEMIIEQKFHWCWY